MDLNQFKNMIAAKTGPKKAGKPTKKAAKVGIMKKLVAKAKKPE